MKTIIHVNQHVIRSNAKSGANDPVLTVKTYKSNAYAHGVSIHGPSRVVYKPQSPLSCGAKVWIETESEVTLIHAKNELNHANSGCNLSKDHTDSVEF